MTRPELGVKRDCPNCGARFYDLNKDPAHCPKCDTEFTPEALLKPRRARREDDLTDEAKAAAAVPKPVAETSLEAADKEARAAKSKRKAGLDEEPADAEGEDIEDIEDIELEIEDDDVDDTLLEDDEDDDDGVVGIVGGDDEEDV